MHCGNLVIFPSQGLNKKYYTPDKIYQVHYSTKFANGIITKEGESRSYREQYRLIELVYFFIRSENKEDLELLLKDYPSILTYYSKVDENPIFYAIKNNNVDILELFKKYGADFETVGLEELNVYQYVIDSPDLWSLVYSDISSEQLYENLTLKADEYENGVFEFLFLGSEDIVDILKEFKKRYPVVFEKIITEQADNSMIKKATGETLMIIHNYENLENELNLYYDGKLEKVSPKVLKF